MAGNDTTVTVSGVLLRETDAALLVEFPLPGSARVEEVWLPRSRVSYMRRIPKDGEVRVILTIPEWLAEDRGLHYD